MARRLRKHRSALLALAVYNLVLFFPVLFMGRVVSPNDVFYNYEPWSTYRPAEVQTQNATMNDPPTAYFTLMTMARDDWRTFHWNPYIASGIPGFGSSASAILSPFILLPALLVPLAWVYTAILFLKLNASFAFAYLWLREERLGRNASAVGAIVIAGTGVYAVRWLWQITNATALYPALLWITRRMMRGKRTSLLIVTPLALAYALSGFPAAMAYGAWIVTAYAIVCAIAAVRPKRVGGFGWRATIDWRPVLGVVFGVMIALPSLVPFVQFLGRSGYLEMREGTSLVSVFPPEHWRNFLDPDRLGHPAHKDWQGDGRLGPLNNYTETTVYLGLLTLPLALLGVFSRRARMRWFWLASAIVILGCMFGLPLIASWMSQLPGFKFSALARVALLLPLPIGYLAAAGSRLLRRPLLLALLGAVIAYDLAVVAGRVHPYLEPRSAAVPETPMTRFLRAEHEPFRVAPMFDYLWPNTAELVRVEDVRSHFGSERDYRRMLQRLDPTAWGGRSTVITFNSLQYQFLDPLNALLGIRWFIEHDHIDIIKWSVFSKTVPGVKETGSLPFAFDTTLERTIRVDAEPFWAIEFPVDVLETRGARPRLEASLLKNGAKVWARSYTSEETNVFDKIYIPLRPYARLGESVTLRVRAVGMRGYVLQGENVNRAEAALFYGRVTIPIVYDRQLPDGRLFRNLAELPRFRAVSKLRKLNDDEFLAARDVDFATEAVITDDPVMPPSLAPTDARVTLTHYAPDEQHIVTDAAGTFYLASSEKLTPELRVTIDGREARAIETDMLFAGLEVPAGRHQIVFSRRIARGWWWVAALGLGLWIVSVAISFRRPG